MQAGFDEQAWWAGMFNGGVDPALEPPDRAWDAALAAALDPETPQPPDDILPPDDPIPDDELDVEASAHHEFEPWATGADLGHPDAHIGALYDPHPDLAGPGGTDDDAASATGDPGLADSDSDGSAGEDDIQW